MCGGLREGQATGHIARPMAHADQGLSPNCHDHRCLVVGGDESGEVFRQAKRDGEATPSRLGDGSRASGLAPNSHSLSQRYAEAFRETP